MTKEKMFIDDEDESESTENQTPKNEAVAEEQKTEPKPQTLSTKYYDVTLPSQGKLSYPKTIQYRDILVRDEKIIMSATNDNYPKVINRVLKSVLGDVDFYDDLVIHDRDFLLTWIWANNYDPVKSIQVECPDCSHVDNVDVDLTKLNVEDIPSDFVQPFEIDVDDNITIGVNLVTVGDEKEAARIAEESNEYDYETILYYLSIDVPIDYNTLDEKFEWIEENMKGRDMAMVRSFHEYFAFGVENEIEHKCTGCGEVNRHTVPFRPEWLLPDSSRDFKNLLQSNKASKNKSKRSRSSSTK